MLFLAELIKRALQCILCSGFIVVLFDVGLFETSIDRRWFAFTTRSKYNSHIAAYMYTLQWLAPYTGNSVCVQV